MERLILTLIFILIINTIHSQGNTLYQTGLTAEQNLSAIGSLAPYSTGGVGFDTRYKGIKGSQMLFDTLLPSLLNIKGQDYYLQLKTDIDPTRNTLVFLSPKTGKLLSIPSDIVNEVKINDKGREFIFRSTNSKYFEKGFKEEKFYQVLKDGVYQFIKIPNKKLIVADYKEGYSADRRYDEYTTYYKYYLMSHDSTFHQIQLTKKSLIRIIPDRKELINTIFDSKSYVTNEERVLAILDKL